MKRDKINVSIHLDVVIANGVKPVCRRGRQSVNLITDCPSDHSSIFNRCQVGFFLLGRHTVDVLIMKYSKSNYYKISTIPGPVPGSACNLRYTVRQQTDPGTGPGIITFYCFWLRIYPHQRHTLVDSDA